ncbi:unnamed protein product [Symbiodinium sp. KB8]|nr:unnamed protein product [Symbiodinium sp. KB8]
MQLGALRGHQMIGLVRGPERAAWIAKELVGCGSITVVDTESPGWIRLACPLTGKGELVAPSPETDAGAGADGLIDGVGGEVLTLAMEELLRVRAIVVRYSAILEEDAARVDAAQQKQRLLVKDGSVEDFMASLDAIQQVEAAFALIADARYRPKAWHVASVKEVVECMKDQPIWTRHAREVVRFPRERDKCEDCVAQGQHVVRTCKDWLEWLAGGLAAAAQGDHVRPRQAASFFCLGGKAVLSGAQGSRLASAALNVFGFGHNPSFWMGAFEEANTLLDRYAQQVFWLHATRLGHTDASVRACGRTAGAEYWVQRRGPEQPLHERGMDWHFDKDEDLLDQKDVVVMPTVGTVTYLSSVGAPLVVLSQPMLDGRGFLLPFSASQVTMFLTRPVFGRHVAFDGQLLHGCPAALAEAGERLSLVVNIWFEHKPLGVSTTGPGSSNSKLPVEAEEVFSTATPLRPIDQEAGMQRIRTLSESF